MVYKEVDYHLMIIWLAYELLFMAIFISCGNKAYVITALICLPQNIWQNSTSLFKQSSSLGHDWVSYFVWKYLCKGERSQNIPRRMKRSIILLLHVAEPTEIFQEWSRPQNLKLRVQTRHTVGNMFLYTSSKEKTGFVERPELGTFWYSS